MPCDPSLSPGITAIILTFNEEKHIARCIASLRGVVARICIIDSFSTDRTAEIAAGLGADVFRNPWENYARQFQWGIDNAGIATEWTMRIDADEYLEGPLQDDIRSFLASPGDVNAVYLRRKMIFLGREIRHGFFYPSLMLRLWRSGQGQIEQRWMDEHIIVAAPVTRTLHAGDLVDANRNDLAWWTGKHVAYARREVYDIVASAHRDSARTADDLSGQARLKRFLKESIYYKLPTFIRSSTYFFYRYVIGRGFLDGKAGFFFHFLQAYWYRTLVDAMLYELEQEAREHGLSAHALLRQRGIL